MFIAHLPAGYLLTKYIQGKSGNISTRLLWVGLIASIFPDIDLFYFYLVDNRQTLHHHYITHLPLAWSALALTSYFTLWVNNKKRYNTWVSVVFVNVILHIFLDSVASGIPWLYPFSKIELNLVQVPDLYNKTFWNFVLHWTFLLEIMIILTALIVWKRSCKKIS